jgi:enoyl-CoA hydratase/carnithine racemase
MFETQSVTLETDDGVAVVSLNRPQARNALDLPMCHRLTEVFQDIDADPSIRAVLLRAEGPSFCAGADLKERQDKDAAWVRLRRIASFAAYDAIAACTRPVIALVHGNIVGSGGEIAMSCDVIYASESAVFRFPEAHWGTIGATQRLQRVIGKRKAKELLFTNGSLPAVQALDLGLVQAVVSDQGLAEHGLQQARLMAAAPAQSMELTKKAIDMGEQVTLAQGINIEMSFIEQNLASGQWKDGVERFAAARADSAGNAGSKDRK